MELATSEIECATRPRNFRLRRDTVKHSLTFTVCHHEASFSQDLQMVGEQTLLDVEHFR